MKNVTVIRGISLILFLLMLTSCGGSPAGNAETTAAAAVTTTEALTTADYLSVIPAVDFGGRSFRIVVNDQPDRPNLHAGELNGEVINDAMVERDHTVE